jgi:hypothetical protein
MSEVDVLADGETLGILIRQNNGTGGLGLTDHIGCAWVVQEAVVDAAGVPGIHAMGASEARIADERVTSAIIVSGVVVGAVVVLLWVYCKHHRC